MPVLGDIYDMESRLQEYDPALSLVYNGGGKWSVWHDGRQGRPYCVLVIGEGTGNRWPKDDPSAEEITRPDMRLLYLIRDADFAARRGGHEQMVREMEQREQAAREANRAEFAEHVEVVARDFHKFHVRDVDGMPDYRITFPAAKPAAKEAS